MSSLALACRLGAGSPITLPRRVRSILNKYGATLLMPGPAVPILGPELVSNGGFDADGFWDKGAGWAIGDGKAVATASTSRLRSLSSPLTAGGTYEVSVTCSEHSAGSYKVLFEGGTSLFGDKASAGTFGGIFTAAQAGQVYIWANTALTAKFDNVSVREVLGYQNTYSSFIAGNHRESTGQNLAAVDQQVGLVIDAGQQSGSELAAPVSAWTLSIDPSLALVGEEAVFTAAPTGQLITCPMSISEKTLAVEFEISEYVAGTLQVRTIGGTTYTSSVTHSGNGRKREVIKALTGNSTLGIRVASTFTGRVKLISVRELPGIHPSQATSGFQPYLRKVPKTLGPELRAGFSPNVIGVATPAVYDAAAGTATLYRVDVNNQSRLGISGLDMSKKYLVEVTNNGPASISVRTNNGANVKVNALAGERISYVAELETTPDLMIVGGTNGSSASISGISVREVLEWTYAWQFDGTDDRLSLSAVPFQMSDDHFVIAGANQTVTTSTRPLFSNSGTTARACQLQFFDGVPQAVWVDDSGTNRTVVGSTVTAGISVVLSGIKQGLNKYIRQDGTQRQNNALSVGPATTTVAEIGARSGGSIFFSGHIHVVIFGKGAISDSELLTLEKFAAKLQGRSL